MRQPSLKDLAAKCLSTDKSQPSVGPSTTLEHRIRAMAARWRYSPAELVEVLDLARQDPDKWQRAVSLDEQREQEFRANGLLPRADA